MSRSLRHVQVHLESAAKFGTKADITDSGAKGQELRSKLKDHFEENRGENEDMGIEMGQPYDKSPIICLEKGTTNPTFEPRRYIPTTIPGYRAPFIYLGDGKPLYDLFGDMFTLVSFYEKADAATEDFLKSAKSQKVEIKLVSLPHETKLAQLYEKKLVLLRPDMYVAWRGDEFKAGEGERVLKTILGF